VLVINTEVIAYDLPAGTVNTSTVAPVVMFWFTIAIFSP
jgi:hypothetical protein